MKGLYAAWFRGTPETRQASRARLAMLVYGFLLLELVVPQGRRGFWFTLAIAPLGAISLLQIVMRSDSLWFDRAAMLLAASLGLLGWWLTGSYMLAIIALLILLVCVVDVALHRRHLP